MSWGREVLDFLDLRLRFREEWILITVLFFWRASCNLVK